MNDRDKRIAEARQKIASVRKSAASRGASIQTDHAAQLRQIEAIQKSIAETLRLIDSRRR
jgi:hypothetical protein